DPGGVPAVQLFVQVEGGASRAAAVPGGSGAREVPGVLRARAERGAGAAAAPIASGAGPVPGDGHAAGSGGGEPGERVPSGVLPARAAHGAAPEHPEGCAGAVRGAVLRGAAAVQREADGRVPRAADRAWEVDV